MDALKDIAASMDFAMGRILGTGDGMTKTVDSTIGVFDDLSFANYQAIDAVNQSLLCLFDRSAAHAYHSIISPAEPSAEQWFGSAFHAAVLEPDRFAAEYIAAPKCDRRTKAGKELWAQFEAEHSGMTVLRADDYATLQAMRSAVRENSAAAQLLDGGGTNERSIVWRDEQTALLCKARIDRMAIGDGHTAVVDLKTARNASQVSFRRAIAEYHYAVQAAFYLDGLDSFSPLYRQWVFIAVEKTPPFACAVYELDQESIEFGRVQYRKWLEQYKQCVESGVWPGYPARIQSIGLPRWKLAREDIA